MASRSTDYDVIVVGAGPAGLFAAYHLCENSSLRVLIIEKARALSNAAAHQRLPECFKCKPCDILSGIGGAGLFSTAS